MTFQVILPKFSLPQDIKLRSSTEPEELISDIYVLVFEIDASANNAEKLAYKYKVTASDIIDQDKNSNGNNVVTFHSWLKLQNNYNIAIIANTAEVPSYDNNPKTLYQTIHSDEAYPVGIPVGTTKTEVLEALNIINAAPWLTSLSGRLSTTVIPMYGETSALPDATGTITDVKLKRMLASIDVIVDENVSNFILEEVYLCNFNIGGMVSPKKETTSDKVETGPATEPNFMYPMLLTGFSNALKYNSVTDNSIVKQIYAFESNGADNSNSNDGQAATCLVIKGIYNGKSYYYRVDFTDNNGNYMPLLRNYKYEVRIERAAGIGYDKGEDALSSYTVISNLKTRVLSYDEGEMKDINYNGQYYIAMTDDGAWMNASGKEIDNSGNTTGSQVFFYAKTDYPKGFEVYEEAGIDQVSVTNDEAGTTKCDWLIAHVMSMPPNNNTHLLINVATLSAMPSGENVRVAYVNLKAGRLNATYEIIQTREFHKTSNCYIVKPVGNTVTIPIYRAEEGIPGSLKRRDKFEKEFIWTDNIGGMGTNGSVESATIYGNGRKALLLVKTGNTEGNTVIAVKGNDGKIKWSWHIWVTNYEPSGDIMDRNLGALSNLNTPVSEWWKSRGLFYQWGRKDPFPNSYKGTSPFPLFYYDEDGTEVLAAIESASSGDLQASVEKPLKFFSDGYLSTTSWTGSAGSDSWGYNSSGNNKKSVYDPSPIGWKVPNDASAFESSNYEIIGKWWTDANEIGSPHNGNYDGGHNITINGITTFYPATGIVTFGTTSKLVVNNSVAKYGLYWTAEAENSLGPNAYTYTISRNGKGKEEKNKDRGFSVRCVRDN